MITDKLKNKRKKELIGLGNSLGLTDLEGLSKKELLQKLESASKQRFDQGKPFEPGLNRDLIEELPEDYNETQVVLLPQNARVGYVFWELATDLLKESEKIEPDGRKKQFLLRICGISQSKNLRTPDFFMDYRLDTSQESVYLKMPRPDYTYQAAIGFMDDATFKEITHSRPIHFPRNFAAWTTPVHFRDLPEDLNGNTTGKDHKSELGNQIDRQAKFISIEELQKAFTKQMNQRGATAKTTRVTSTTTNNDNADAAPNNLEGTLPSSAELLEAPIQASKVSSGENNLPSSIDLPSSDSFLPESLPSSEGLLPTSYETIPFSAETTDIPYLPQGVIELPSSAESTGIIPLPSSEESLAQPSSEQLPVIPAGYFPGDTINQSAIDSLPSSYEMPGSYELTSSFEIPSSADSGSFSVSSLSSQSLNPTIHEVETKPLDLSPIQIPEHADTENEDMFLIAATELRVYGRTNPDALLEINGKYYPTDVNGEFSFALPLPDSTRKWEILARRGNLWRKITKDIDKISKREGFPESAETEIDDNLNNEADETKDRKDPQN